MHRTILTNVSTSQKLFSLFLYIFFPFFHFSRLILVDFLGFSSDSYSFRFEPTQILSTHTDFCNLKRSTLQFYFIFFDFLNYFQFKNVFSVQFFPPLHTIAYVNTEYTLIFPTHCVSSLRLLYARGVSKRVNGGYCSFQVAVVLVCNVHTRLGCVCMM